MKNRSGIKIFSIAFILIAILIIASSCRNNKVKKPAIPEKAFTAILSDIYLADGLLSMSKIRDEFSKKDSIAIYIDIIKSHGYTFNEMEKTLDYYFSEDPKGLVKIYDRIDEKLSSIQLKVTSDQEKLLNAMNTKAKNRNLYRLPDPNTEGKPEFKFDIYPPGSFTLEFSVTIYPDDRSVNPSFIGWYSEVNSKDSTICNYFPQVKYLKDGLPHVYTVKGHIKGNKKSVLKGFYLDYENDQAPAAVHADITHLSFSYIGDNL